MDPPSACDCEEAPQAVASVALNSFSRLWVVAISAHFPSPSASKDDAFLFKSPGGLNGAT
jgi:hypothetical protein